MSEASCLIRELTSADEPFLWEMLYQALFVPPGSELFPPEIIRQPEISRYVDGWGQPGDSGFIAIDEDSQQPIGAAWVRLMTGDNKGYGYIDDETPELTIAVTSEFRGNGNRQFRRFIVNVTVTFVVAGHQSNPGSADRLLRIFVNGDEAAVARLSPAINIAANFRLANDFRRKQLTARRNEQGLIKHFPQERFVCRSQLPYQTTRFAHKFQRRINRTDCLADCLWLRLRTPAESTSNFRFCSGLYR